MYVLVMVYGKEMDRVLVRNKKAGLNNFIGGTIINGEDPIQACYRRLYTEAGLKPADICLSYVGQERTSVNPLLHDDIDVFLMAGLADCEKVKIPEGKDVSWKAAGIPFLYEKNRVFTYLTEIMIKADALMRTYIKNGIFYGMLPLPENSDTLMHDLYYKANRSFYDALHKQDLLLMCESLALYVRDGCKILCDQDCYKAVGGYSRIKELVPRYFHQPDEMVDNIISYAYTVDSTVTFQQAFYTTLMVRYEIDCLRKEHSLGVYSRYSI